MAPLFLAAFLALASPADAFFSPAPHIGNDSESTRPVLMGSERVGLSLFGLSLLSFGAAWRLTGRPRRLPTPPARKRKAAARPRARWNS